MGKEGEKIVETIPVGTRIEGDRKNFCVLPEDVKDNRVREKEITFFITGGDDVETAAGITNFITKLIKRSDVENGIGNRENPFAEIVVLSNTNRELGRKGIVF